MTEVSTEANGCARVRSPGHAEMVTVQGSVVRLVVATATWCPVICQKASDVCMIVERREVDARHDLPSCSRLLKDCFHLCLQTRSSTTSEEPPAKTET
jgi:hypothetical protein